MRQLPFLLFAPFLFFTLFRPEAAASGSDELLGRTLDEWSEKITTSEGEARSEAAWAIAQLASATAGEIGDQIGFAELVKLVNDHEPKVRYWGIQGLSSFARRLSSKDGGQTAVHNALEPLLDDPAPEPRIAAALVAAQLGNTEKSLPVLTSALRDRADSVRLQAAAALEQLGPTAQPAAASLRSAATDSNEYIRRIATRALIQLQESK